MPWVQPTRSRKALVPPARVESSDPTRYPMTVRGILRAMAAAMLVAVAAAIASSRAEAQSPDTRCTGTREYRGRCVSIPLVPTDPGNYRDCNQVRGRSQPEVFACVLAVGEARNMALYYAGGHGRMYGFDRGLTAGM